MKTRPWQSTLFLRIAFLCLSGLGPLPAATLVWVGGDGYWTNAANWTPAQVPGIGDTASIASGTITLTGDVGVQTLNLDGGGLTGAGTFYGVLNWSGGAFNAISLTIAHGSQLNLVGNADKLLAVGVITNHGVFNWSGGGSFKFGFDQAY